MKKDIVLIKAPSVLGLRPSGVEEMPDALERAGIAHELRIHDTRTVTPPPYNPKRDKTTLMLNPKTLSTYSVSLADTVEAVIGEKQFPLVIGGDCSITLGTMLALKRKGRYGLLFIDAHADFYQPEKSPTGEAADMDLALVSGRGPDIVTNIERQKPFVHDDDIVLFGQRDKEETIAYGSQQVSDTGIHVFELQTIRRQGAQTAADAALRHVLKQQLDGFWIHVDVDVLDDAIMPAVDYHLPDGLSFQELTLVLGMALASGKAMGMSVSIFNPRLDRDGTLAKQLVKHLAQSFFVAVSS